MKKNNGKQKTLTPYEKEILEITKGLRKHPDGETLFNQYYVQNGFASTGDWQKFVTKKNK